MVVAKLVRNRESPMAFRRTRSRYHDSELVPGAIQRSEDCWRKPLPFLERKTFPTNDRIDRNRRLGDVHLVEQFVRCSPGQRFPRLHHFPLPRSPGLFVIASAIRVTASISSKLLLPSVRRRLA